MIYLLTAVGLPADICHIHYHPAFSGFIVSSLKKVSTIFSHWQLSANYAVF